MNICGKCGLVMKSKERKIKDKIYLYDECLKCGSKTKSYEKNKLLRAG